MKSQKLKSIIEGMLFLAGEEGLNAKQISEVTDQPVQTVQIAIEELQADLKKARRGIQVVNIAGGYQLSTIRAHAEYYERLAYSPSRSSLSQAALETLSIVAYRQPITRIEIEEIRGVKSERAIYTLVNKDLIQETGRAEAIGRPILYGTTKSFLDYFGLGNIRELPDASAFENADDLEGETQLLFDRLEEKVHSEDIVELEALGEELTGIAEDILSESISSTEQSSSKETTLPSSTSSKDTSIED
ncbi:Segregation and condensation protein [Paenibacillus nuruki]|uniref:Segregation and condensation protein B n=1 Tax=Paenibacillus nuruki TaxID=1886670 RepID=A0A1E3L2M8_9BACL|nr:SMC-Scp complex subunit ScpB [Paenibacillus nuruki]ODP28057.1 Segregation and condensation protein [Paenibacillus nuruki]